MRARTYDGTRSGVEREIRGFLRTPEKALETVEVRGRYELEDTFYVPRELAYKKMADKKIPHDHFWHPSRRTLRLRKFGDRGTMLVLSVYTMQGFIKEGYKHVIMHAPEEDIASVLADMGFSPIFKIRREKGFFMHLPPDTSFVAEKIEGVGWMFEAHLRPEEKGTHLPERICDLMKAIGVTEKDLLKTSLPEYYITHFY